MEFEQLSMFQETGFKMKKVKPMKILVACEESQAVCIELRKLGHEAYSADIQECSGGHPEWHILGDVIPLINGYCMFYTMDGVQHEIIGEWDMLIAHPPCTHLAVSGARWFKEGLKPMYLQDEAADFFMKFINAKCKKIVVENPVCVMSTRYKKPTQIIHPWQFGHPEQKRTCLWIKGLPKIVPTKIMEKHEPYVNGGCKDAHGNYRRFQGRKERDPKTRSKTFPGIAKAIAEQLFGDARDYVEEQDGRS